MSDVNVMIAFYSRTGVTEALAKAIADGAERQGAEVRLRRAREFVSPEIMAKATGWADAADAMYLGLARHFVPQDRFDELTAALAEESSPVDAVLARFAGRPGASRLQALRPAIDRCFDHGSVEANHQSVSPVQLPEDDRWGRVGALRRDRHDPLPLRSFRPLAEDARITWVPARRGRPTLSATSA